MSLRDQLLKAGLVDKKRARKVNRDAKQERRRKQSQQLSKSERKKQQAERRRAKAAARQAELAGRRQQADTAREERDRKRLMGSLMTTSQVRVHPGNQVFFHMRADQVHLRKLRLPESAAWDLRAGKLAVAWAGLDADQPEPYVLIRASAARRMAEIQPERVVFFNDTPAPEDDPAEQLLPTDFPWSEPRLRRVPTS